MSLAWDSQKVQNTSTPRPAASAAVSRADPTLADARRSHHVHHSTVATDRAIQHGVEGRHLPAPTDQGGLRAPHDAIARADRQKPSRAHGFVGPLDAHPLGVTQHHGVLDESRGELGQHHRAGGCRRFHPLGKPDLLTDRGVTRDTRTDLTGNDLARIQAHPQPQRDTVTVLHLARQPDRLLLDGQRGQARPDRVVLQRNRRPEQRHQAIAGELLHRAAVALHRGCAAADQFGHDLA